MATARARPGGQVLHSSTGASEQIAAQLRIWLEQQQLKAGERIGTEQELADEFGVSRPTMREALRLLSAAHLIRVGRGRAGGIFVARTPSEGMSRNLSESIALMLSAQTISMHELLDARLSLEVPIAGRAAVNADDEVVARLEQAIADAEGHQPGSEAWNTADGRFHATLAEASGNQLLHALTGWILEVLQPSLIVTISAARRRRGDPRPAPRDPARRAAPPAPRRPRRRWPRTSSTWSRSSTRASDARRVPGARRGGLADRRRPRRRRGDGAGLGPAGARVARRRDDRRARRGRRGRGRRGQRQLRARRDGRRALGARDAAARPALRRLQHRRARAQEGGRGRRSSRPARRSPTSRCCSRCRAAACARPRWPPAPGAAALRRALRRLGDAGRGRHRRAGLRRLAQARAQRLPQGPGRRGGRGARHRRGARLRATGCATTSRAGSTTPTPPPSSTSSRAAASTPCAGAPRWRRRSRCSRSSASRRGSRPPARRGLGELAPEALRESVS